MIENIALILFIVLLIPVSLQNLLGPIIVKQTQRLDARFKFIPYAEPDFMLRQDEHYLAICNELKALGFDYVGSSSLAGSHSDSDFSLFCNDQERCSAMLASISSKVMGLRYIEFTQLYADGSILDVSNATQASVFPHLDIKIALRYPELKTVDALYQRFVALRNSLKNSASPVPYDKSKVFSNMETYMERESDELVAKGYCLKPIDANGKRQLTWKGAILLTWKSVAPGRIIKSYLDKAYAKKMLSLSNISSS